MGGGGNKTTAGGATAIVSGNDWDATVLAPEDAFIGKLGAYRAMIVFCVFRG